MNITILKAYVSDVSLTRAHFNQILRPQFKCQPEVFGASLFYTELACYF